jgi:uncharacterized protein YuzB (UPF0349 family)
MVRCDACGNGDFKKELVDGETIEGNWFCDLCSSTYSEEELLEFAE